MRFVPKMFTMHRKTNAVKLSRLPRKQHLAYKKEEVKWTKLDVSVLLLA